MKKITVLFMFCALMTVSACSTPNTPIDELRALVEEVEKNCDTYTEEDLENVIARVEALDDKMKQYEYTDEQLREIGVLEGRLARCLSKVLFKELGTELGNFTQELFGGIGGFFGGFMDEVETEKSEEQLREEWHEMGKVFGKNFQDRMKGGISPMGKEEISHGRRGGVRHGLIPAFP